MMSMGVLGLGLLIALLGGLARLTIYGSSSAFVVILGLVVALIGFLMQSSLIEVKGVLGTFFGVILAFTLAQWAITAREERTFRDMNQSLLSELSSNRALLLKMRREYKKTAISIERIYTPSLDTVLKDPMIMKYGKYDYLMIASVSKQTIDGVNRASDFIQRRFEGTDQGTVSDANLKLIRERVAYATNNIEIMQRFLSTLIDSKASDQDKQKKISALINPEGLTVQLQKTYEVSSVEDSDLYQVDLRTKQTSSGYLGLIYEISKDLRKSEKIHPQAIENKELQDTIKEADQYIRKVYKVT